MCGDSKELTEFHRSSTTKDGYKPICKSYKKIIRHQCYIKNKNHEYQLSVLWRKNNKDKSKRIYRRKNIERKEYFKNYRIAHRKQRAEYEKWKLKNDINYNLSSKLRHRLTEAIKSQNINKTNKALELLGCNINDFKKHLQSQFKIGMTWGNYGKWHIDHIKPCASFDLTNLEEQKICFHYSNMQPLWAHENLQKWKK